ncbi:LAFE_0G02806g1_1 [Lachancea fermentati]|uniref:Restriction of telomere capping protein 4 n=1 Tax=Lachancea fermentati TaxID=4955 RepID=A0A1G4MH16_LACFM|nr:LAFE_0G02806g1_1 [Lachancea fermentati]
MSDGSPTLRRNRIHSAIGVKSSVLEVLKRHVPDELPGDDSAGESDSKKGLFHRQKINLETLDNFPIDELDQTKSSSEDEERGHSSDRIVPGSPKSDTSQDDAINPVEEIQLVQQDIDEEEIRIMKRINKRGAEDTTDVDVDNDGPLSDIFETPSKKLKKIDPCDTKEHLEKRNRIKEKYNEIYDIPPALLAEELTSKIEKHMPLVIEILEGRRPSLFYDYARRAHNKSQRAILSVDEFRMLDLGQFIAGFYGLKRQMRVAVEIMHRYKEQLTTNDNSVLRWWGPSDFAQYVLAPELLSALCQEEMKLSSIDQAWDVIENTSEYGLVVTDEDPFEEWEVKSAESNGYFAAS